MLDPKYIPLFLGGFVLWMVFIVAVGFFGSRGKRDRRKFLTGGSDMKFGGDSKRLPAWLRVKLPDHED